MNPRERMLRALEYRSPDRMPIYCHPSPAGLYRHGRKLLDLFRAYPPDNAVEFAVPEPDPADFGPDGAYRRTEVDEWGTEWEYCAVGLQGSPRGLPLADLDRVGEYRLPPAPEPRGPAFEEGRARIAGLKEDYLTFGGWFLLFEKLCELRPMDDVLVELYTGEERLLGLLEAICDRAAAAVEYQLELGTDVLFFGDDWGFQTGPAISPEKFRELFAARYRRLFDRVRAAGARVLFHSCGQLGGILDEILRLGVDCIWHQTGCYDPAELAGKCRAAGAAAFIHPDRQYLVPRGTPAEIREAVAGYAAIYRRLGGGGIFYVEIENDTPFENVEAMVTAMHEPG
jgi:uroporphyrinogen decarboxylase